MKTNGYKIRTKRLSLLYGPKLALNEVTLNIRPNNVTALIGPSGCGKSTFLRSLNRMNDLIENVHTTGEVLVDDVDIYRNDVDVVEIKSIPEGDL